MPRSKTENTVIISYWVGVIKRKGLHHLSCTKHDIASAVWHKINGGEGEFSGDDPMGYLTQQYHNVMKSKAEAGQVVYFIGNREHKWVKIGYTGNIKSRLCAIQVSCPFKVSVLGTLKVTKDTARDSETILHKRFAANRINGEWFTLTDEMEKLIAHQADVKPIKAQVMPKARLIAPIDFMDERKIAQRQKPRRYR
jgi:hypothetical protein